MSGKHTTQEIEANDLIEEMKTELSVQPTPATACTPEAHAQVVHSCRTLTRGQIWIIRHMGSRENGNGHNARLELGPLKISGLTATVVTRITLLSGIGYVIAKMHGWI